MKDEQPRAYRCKHGCERDALKDMIRQQGENAATAAKEYAANIADLRKEVERLRESLDGTLADWEIAFRAAFDEHGTALGKPTLTEAEATALNQMIRRASELFASAALKETQHEG